MKNRKRNQKGFSLIELLVVVAIILIVAAIAIPNLLQARVAANEASAVASLRTINTAMITYNSSYPTVGFAPTLVALSGTNCAPPAAQKMDTPSTQRASAPHPPVDTSPLDCPWPAAATAASAPPKMAQSASIQPAPPSPTTIPAWP